MQAVSLHANMKSQMIGDIGNKCNGRERESALHNEINNPICCESLHVLVQVPLPGCCVHQNQLPRGLANSRNQEHSTENKSQDPIIQMS